MKTKTVVGLGEVLWDIFPEGKKLGGAPANFAYHVAQLGLDGIVVSAIGNDELGDEIIACFEDKGLPHMLENSSCPTGTVQVSINERGVPQYTIEKGVAWDNIQYNETLKALANRTDCVCFGSLAQRNSVSRNTIEQFLNDMPIGSYKVFDINLRQHFYTKEQIGKSFSLCNILKLNDEELDKVCNMFDIMGTSLQQCQTLLTTYGWKMLILTCGEMGSYIITSNDIAFLETPKVKVVDTVGAGDSFTAAFCTLLLKGEPVRKAHRRAVDVSAYVCTQAGAMPVLPNHLK
ncbi:carbohydrate kinase family protein [Bacteroides oleiciplenus]|uniref:carbohydrate kinase family protein n=1 Tax=Bacteroides oleiciplenus TaxID=626931 RepID=UPI0026DB08E9|nr:carbohydrate kinase [Bacteroides oleiciplenus]